MRDELEGATTTDGVPGRLIRTTVRLLAEKGPSAIKARTIASATGLSTMSLYSHFGGLPELTLAVRDHGFRELDKAFAGVPVTDDAIADLAGLALTCRGIARGNPHLYDLMFGLSTRATYRPQNEPVGPLGSQSQAFRGAYARVEEACIRAMSSGRITEQETQVVAAQLWGFVHGFVTLEMAEIFAECDDPVGRLLLPIGVNLFVGLGDTRERAHASHETAARRYDSTSRDRDGGATQ
ncbi:MAG TPA: TetR/AcrR family transcriptional regulator [Mycobacterium sp.]